MTSYNKTIAFLKTFHAAADDISRDFSLSLTHIIMAQHKAHDEAFPKHDISNAPPPVGMADFIKIARNRYAPDALESQFNKISKDILNLNTRELLNLSGETLLTLELTQLPIKDISQKLHIAGYDWKNMVPKEMPYSESKTYFMDHHDEIMDTLELIKHVYEETNIEIKNTILRNTSYILTDLGIEIK